MKNIFITVSLFAFMLLLSLYSCNKGNTLKINFEQGIDRSATEVKMEVLASVPMTTIYNGKDQFTIPNGYGENEWYFTYNDTLRGYVRHIKTNRNDKHIYHFKFYTEGKKFFVGIEIKGDSPLKTQVELK